MYLEGSFSSFRGLSVSAVGLVVGVCVIIVVVVVAVVGTSKGLCNQNTLSSLQSGIPIIELTSLENILFSFNIACLNSLHSFFFRFH